MRKKVKQENYIITGYDNYGYYNWIPSVAFDGNTSNTRDMDLVKNITFGYLYPSNYLQFKVKINCKINIFYGSKYPYATTYLYSELGTQLASVSGNGMSWVWHIINYNLEPNTNYRIGGYNTVICQIKFT